MRAPASLMLTVALLGCSDETVSPAPAPRHPPQVLTPLDAAPLSSDQTLEPAHAILEASGELNPSNVDALAQMLDEGFGELNVAAGEPLIARTLDDAPPPAPGPNAKLLTRFVHLADIQLADDESPARFAALDLPGVGAFRPQEGYGCRILNAAVRSINRLHADLPLDFVLLGGDNVDSAQQNEHGWLLQVLSGGDDVECDSGADDDPVTGPANDPKDPFVAEGLSVPWLWVTGNHDVLVQGLSPIEQHLERATGSEAAQGARDWSLPGAPVVKGDVPPDANRIPLTVDAMLQGVMADGDGHGIDGDVLARGKGSYVHDIEGTPLRLLVLDTATALGGSEGLIVDADVDGFIRPELERAASEGKWMIVTSHHSSNTLAEPGAIGSPNVDGAWTQDQWQSLVGTYPQVLLHLAGHSHIHRVHRREPAGGARYWEVLTSALADYPHQMRMLEVWDQDNGFVSLRMVAFDYATDHDEVAAEGRRRGVTDMTSGWMPDERGAPEDRNVELWVAKP